MRVPDLNEEIVERVNELGATAWSGTTYRHTSVGRDPLSGEGARLLGGRWNPRGVFSTIYLAQPELTAVRELEHAAAAASMSLDDMLAVGRELHTIKVEEMEVLDLRDPVRLAAVGLSPDDVEEDDQTACQAVGHAAWFLEFAGVLAPSARNRQGLVLATFESRLSPGQLRHTKSQRLDGALLTQIVEVTRE